MSRILTIACLSVAVMSASAIDAQLPGIPGAGKLGGLGGMMGGGGALPSLGATGMGNAAGVLGYCVKNKLMREQQGVAQGVLGKLTGKPAVQSSPGFLEGQNGLLQSGGKKLSMDSLPAGLKNQACDMVLSKAKSFM